MYWLYVIYHTTCFFRGRYKTWTRSTHLPLLNAKGIIILFCGMSMRDDLVIALHIIPIFISLSCGECETANAFWQQVTMGVMLWSPLFFFFLRKEGGMGAGGATGLYKFETSAVEYSAYSIAKSVLLTTKFGNKATHQVPKRH